MDTGYIKEFVVLADCMSFSEASNILFISQSSLSKHIQSLEKELGVRLFDRTTRNIELTGPGLAFLIFAQQIDSLCDEARITIDDLNNKASSSLTIATMQNPEYYDLAKYIVSFSQEHSDITFQMVEADEFGLYEMFRKKQVNVFPTFELFREDPEDYTFFPMVRSKINAILRKDHKYASRDSVSVEDLAEERLLLPTRKSTLSRIIIAAFEENGIMPDIVYEGQSVGCIDLVKAGMGVSLHADEFARIVEDDDSIVCVPIDPPIEFVYGAAHRNPAELSNAEKIYLSHLKKFEIR